MPISSTSRAFSTSAPAHGLVARAYGVDERLVEEVLDHHRRVALGHAGQGVALLLVVQLGVVRLAGEEVVDQLAAGRPCAGSSKVSRGRTGPGGAGPGRGCRPGSSRRSAAGWSTASAGARIWRCAGR